MCDGKRSVTAEAVKPVRGSAYSGFSAAASDLGNRA